MFSTAAVPVLKHRIASRHSLKMYLQPFQYLHFSLVILNFLLRELGFLCGAFPTHVQVKPLVDSARNYYLSPAARRLACRQTTQVHTLS